MAYAKLDLRDVLPDLDGFLAAGGLIATYATGTTTPQATYADYTGTPNSNPIVCDSSGQSHIFLDTSLSYKFTFAGSDGVVFYTENGITAGGGGGGTTTVDVAYPLSFEFLGGTPPAASEIMGIEPFTQDVDFMANWAGAQGYCITNPTASFTITIKRNLVTVGTIGISTLGVFTFATSGAAAMSFVAGDKMTLHAQSGTDATLADIGIQMPGTTAP